MKNTNQYLIEVLNILIMDVEHLKGYDTEYLVAKQFESDLDRLNQCWDIYKREHLAIKYVENLKEEQ